MKKDYYWLDEPPTEEDHEMCRRLARLANQLRHQAAIKGEEFTDEDVNAITDDMIREFLREEAEIKAGDREELERWRELQRRWHEDTGW